MIAASLRILDVPVDELIAPLSASLFIDIQAPSAAPSDELLRLDYGANDDMTRAFQLALSSLCDLAPLVISSGQRVRILHDFENASIVLAGVPADADGARRSHATEIAIMTTKRASETPTEKSPSMGAWMNELSQGLVQLLLQCRHRRTLHLYPKSNSQRN